MMHFVRHWHARIGALAALFFLLLSISGIALNHTDGLNLAKREVQASWLMRWYGLAPKVPTRGYLFKNGYIAASDERWVMDGRELQGLVLSENKQYIVGAITWDDMRAIASEDRLFLYMADGQQIDALSSATLPDTPIKRLGLIGADGLQKLVLQTAQSSYATEDGLVWQVLDVEKLSDFNQLVWAKEQVLPKTLSASLMKSFSPSLPLERIVLDLHSGRIFGKYGPLFMDIVALVLIVLSLSGVWIYLRTVRRQSRR